MKKSIFILAAIFAAMFINAQVTLDKIVLDAHLLITTGNPKSYNVTLDPLQAQTIQAPCFYEIIADVNGEEDKGTLQIYDIETLNPYKEVAVPDIEYIYYITQNIFSTDGKIAFICKDQIINEDGQVIFKFDVDKSSDLNYWLARIKGEYKLIVYESKWYGMEGTYGRDATHIYSLPGNGEAQALSTASSPKQSARKVARKGQVLVETENNTYDLRGQEVK